MCIAMSDNIFDRTERLLGVAAMERLAGAKVLLFGVGGVGGWCAEALVRSGVGHLTVVDPDCVDATNINRQLMATTTTVGRPKVEVLRERLLEINPQADIMARQMAYTKDSAKEFDFNEYDYVVDAIDSIADKLELILAATRKDCSAVLVSSMGAAMKMDPTQVRVTEFWKVDGCPLAAVLRKRMRRQKRFPERKFLCVWSPEVIRGSEKGSMVHVTGTMGFTLAGIILQKIAAN